VPGKPAGHTAGPDGRMANREWRMPNARAKQARTRNGASRRSGERVRVQGSPRGEAPRTKKFAPSKRERIAKHPAKVLTFESMDPTPEDSDVDSSDPFPIRGRDLDYVYRVLDPAGTTTRAA